MNSKRKSYEIQKLFPAVGYSGPIYLSFPIRHFLTKKYCRMPKSFLRSEATASNLMLLGSQYPFIRLAAHGTFNNDEPFNSALVFALDKNHDGLLKAGDLYNPSLQAHLVTLNACETALGKVATQRRGWFHPRFSIRRSELARCRVMAG